MPTDENILEITIKGHAKNIAALVQQIQERRDINRICSKDCKNYALFGSSTKLEDLQNH